MEPKQAPRDPKVDTFQNIPHAPAHISNLLKFTFLQQNPFTQNEPQQHLIVTGLEPANAKTAITVAPTIKVRTFSWTEITDYRHKNVKCPSKKDCAASRLAKFVFGARQISSFAHYPK
jgi:hypothetical protein